MGLGGERLARFQFFHIARQLKSEFFTGEVRARAKNEAITVRFSEGEPVDALSDSMKFSFPAFLLGRKLLDREETARLLEKSSRLGMKLEETLVEGKVYSEKQVRRRKADLSRRLFQTIFDAEGFVWTRVEAEIHEAVDKPFRLDPYEALFMSVFRAEETDSMAMFFSDRWETPVHKTGDLYRHMIQFRSVFFDEEVLETLLAGEALVSEILSRANDQQAALRQCFALCYTGMLAFSEQVSEALYGDQAPPPPGVPGAVESESGRTVMLMPEEHAEAIQGKRRQTQFIGTRPDLDREARQAEAESAEPEVLEIIAEPEAPPEEKPSGEYKFPSAVWGGGSPLEDDPREPSPPPPKDKPEPPKAQPPKPEPVEDPSKLEERSREPEPVEDPSKLEERSREPEPKPVPAVGGPSRAESGRDAPPTEEPEPGKETVFGAPGVAALQPPQPSASQPPITPPTQPTKKRKRQGPETVDDVLQLALQEAEEAIEHLDPKEAAKLTHSGRHFGGASTMDFKDLMVRKKTGDTGKIRTKVSTGPITEPPPDDEDRAPLTAEAPAAPAHDPQPSAISPQAFVEPTPEDAIPAAFDTPKAPMSTVGVPRFLDDDSAPGAPKAPKALEALPPVPPRGLPQPNTDDHIEELLAKEYSEMRSKGFYGVLDVSPTSQFSEMKYAHARLKLRYGSDNYRSYVLSDRAKEILGLINAAVDRAKGLLASRAERRIYDERNDIEYPTDPEEFYSKLFDAYDFFQQASRRMKMTHWVEAYNLLDRAADLNPDESEYYAYRAWSLYQGFRSGQIRDDFAPNKARQLLEKAIQRRDRCERALYYRACLERDLGNIDDAATFYARLLRINPDHPTARDELKEITRPGGRRQGGTPSKKSLWAKLKALFGGSS